MNARSDFVQSLFSYVTKNDLDVRGINIIKSHTISTDTMPDFSFPLQFQIWKQYLNEKQMDNSDKDSVLISKSTENCLEEKSLKCLEKNSEKWPLRITSAVIGSDNRCNIFLNRFQAYSEIIPIVLNTPNYGVVQQKSEFDVHILSIASNDDNKPDLSKLSVTEFRCLLIESVLKNLLNLLNYNLESKSPQSNLYVTYKSTKCSTDPENVLRIICGVVKEGNKTSNMKALEYIEKRCIDMQLIAQHKYGVRIKNEEILQNLMQTIGRAAATVDFLEVKYSSPLTINTPSGTSRGAAFILYNSARLETLFKTFKQKVVSNYYPQLPEIGEIDFSLLKETEEWQLMFNYIIEFPNLLQRTVMGISSANAIAPHLICSFLNGLASTFSVYYRRVRILRENRSHLLPVMYARLYLLNCVRTIMNKSLGLLDIEPVQHM